MPAPSPLALSSIQALAYAYLQPNWQRLKQQDEEIKELKGYCAGTTFSVLLVALFCPNVPCWIIGSLNNLRRSSENPTGCFPTLPPSSLVTFHLSSTAKHADFCPNTAHHAKGYVGYRLVFGRTQQGARSGIRHTTLL